MACMKDAFLEGSLLDGRFETVSPLNHGSFGMVFLAKDTTTGDLVAIKCLTKTSTVDFSPTDFSDDHLVELACHARLGFHPNIVNLIHSFESETHMFLVLEYCSMGDLYEAIRLGRGPLETEHVRDFMFQLLDAVEFMHSKGLYHRDIKPENIFLAQDGSMKLGDFGLSTTETWTYESSVGSDRYMAPEQFDPANDGYSPAQADIWAVGICLLNILFSRNPFVTPSESDILFADFVRDKQSLFDIFPGMSQDTFEVLVHAMAIDPKKRSLSAVRNALQRVLSFTTDGDVLDEFCTEERDVVPASANRQPLRTPSLQAPPLEQGGAFPWAKALHFSPPPRQLSAIPDNESYTDELMFESAVQEPASWYPAPVATSVVSAIDSALGASVKSMQLRQPIPRHLRAEPTKVSGSLPITASKPIPALSSIFGNKESMVSKSWSDLWDEDEEEEELEDMRRKLNDRNWSSETIDEDPTIRPALAEITSTSFANSMNQSPPRDIPGLATGSSVDTTGSFEHLANTTYKLPTYSPPSKRSTVMDKWAALGNRRRAATVEKEEKAETKSKPVTTGMWRRGMNVFSGNMGMGGRKISGSGAAIWERKGKDIPGAHSGVKIRDWRRDQGHHYSFEKHVSEDDGDLEWIGGWQDVHLS